MEMIKVNLCETANASKASREILRSIGAFVQNLVYATNIKDAEIHQDGLTTASMNISGTSGLIVRNFQNKSSIMKKSLELI